MIEYQALKVTKLIWRYKTNLDNRSFHDIHRIVT